MEYNLPQRFSILITLPLARAFISYSSTSSMDTFAVLRFQKLPNYISADIVFFEKGNNRLVIVRALTMLGKILKFLIHICPIQWNKQLLTKTNLKLWNTYNEANFDSLLFSNTALTRSSVKKEFHKKDVEAFFHMCQNLLGRSTEDVQTVRACMTFWCMLPKTYTSLG